MSRVAAVLISCSLLVAGMGCSSPHATPVECRPAHSSLASIDPGTGEVRWQATLDHASELPPQVEDGTVVVTAPCGAAVVDLADGRVRYDGTTPGQVIGVAGDQLFTLDEPDRSSTAVVGVVGVELDTADRGNSLSTNTPFQAATVANGMLVTLYGGELTATEPARLRRAWSLQVPVYRLLRLLRTGRLMLVTAVDGSTFAVDLADGTLVWRTVPPVAATAYDLRVTSVPGTVLTAATTNDEARRSFVYATDAGTGRQRWTRPALSVVGADRDLTVLHAARYVVAVDTRTGAARWRRPLADVSVRTDATAALTRGAVVVPQPGSPTLGLDPTTGRVRWRGPEASAVIADGDVVVLRTLEGVTAVDPRTGATLWSRAIERARQELTVAPDGQLLLLDSDRVLHLGA